MKIVVAPDSYKGCLSSIKVAQAIEEGIHRTCSGASIVKIPMADGGEGTVDAMIMATGGKKQYVEVTNPLGERITTYYGILGDNKMAVIEMASASGLPLIPENLRNPMLTTTFGTGELIMDALAKGCTKILIGIGGSATNDGGMGMAQALGVQFFDEKGKLLGLGGKELEKIHRIDCSKISPQIDQIEFIVACDVTNPLYGPHGAAFTYAPQKGATSEMVVQLDYGLQNFAYQIKKYLLKDISTLPGAGAAGGLGGGLVAFLDAKLRSGIEIMIEATGIEKHIQDASLIITGEGHTDSQTSFGKVPIGIAKIAKKYNTPVICLSGSIDNGIELLYESGITGLFSIVNQPMSLENAIYSAHTLITSATENLIRLISRFQQNSSIKS